MGLEVSVGIAEKKKMAILKMIYFSTPTPSRPVEQDFPGAFWRAHQEMAGHVAMESPTVSQRCVNAVMRRVVGRPVVGLACGLRSMKKKSHAPSSPWYVPQLYRDDKSLRFHGLPSRRSRQLLRNLSSLGIEAHGCCNGVTNSYSKS